MEQRLSSSKNSKLFNGHRYRNLGEEALQTDELCRRKQNLEEKKTPVAAFLHEISFAPGSHKQTLRIANAIFPQLLHLTHPP